MKMMVIGLGKRKGATTYHAAASEFGHEHVIRSSARFILRQVPVLAGIGLIEDQNHQTARIELLKPDEIETREEELFREAKSLMPRLPFKDIDLLIVDRLGKNISGAGMDPNVIGRSVQGYSPQFAGDPDAPSIRRIFVRDLTDETHGNAIGIGLADFTTARAVRSIDKQVTYLNALTALTPQTVKIPIYFDTDREAISIALASLALKDVRAARVVRISDTLSMERIQVSEAYSEQLRRHDKLLETSGMLEMTFDQTGNLLPLNED
jgi:hypothetical protein